MSGAGNFLYNVEFNLVQLLNALIQNVATEPTPATKGRLIYNTSMNKLGVGNGTGYDYMGTGTGGVTPDDVKAIIQGAFLSSDYISLAWDATAKQYTIGTTITADGATNVATLRTLGTGAQQAAPGNDARFMTSDERTKLAGVQAGATQNQTDAYLLDRSHHTGTQTVSTISDWETNVQNKIDAVVNGAPGTLDTLKEIADALGDNPNFATDITNLINGKVNSADLKTVALTGSYKDLTDKPSYKVTIGDGAATNFTITHNLGTQNIVESIKDNASQEKVGARVVYSDPNYITVQFLNAPAAAAFDVTVFGHRA